MFRFLFLALLCGVVNSAAAQPSTPIIQLNPRDLTPRFLQFYDSASRQNLSADGRFALWKKLYGFAATPPTAEGDSIARSLLDGAWPRYADYISSIRHGSALVLPQARRIGEEVAHLLKPDSTITITLLTYVGGFEGNAFTTAQNGNIITAMAVETDSAALPLLLAHELTHAVHIGMGSFSGGWQRSVGATALTEGLAMRVAHQLFPHRREEEITEYSPGWLAAVRAQRREIFRRMLPYLSSDNTDDVMKFTMGKGNLGFEREAYYVGWEVVGYWLQQGKTLAEIARIPEAQMPRMVERAITELLKMP